MQLAPETTRINAPDHPIHPIIAERWSPRAFSDLAVPPEVVRRIFEAARWAPSAANMQPWHFIVATIDEPEAHERLLNTLMEGNIRWARNAPILMLVVVKQYADQEGNLTSRSLYHAGLAVGSLTFEAGANGLAVHQMGGFYADKAREAFDIPDGYEPAAAIAVGYPGDPETLPEDLRAREVAPRTRKPLSEFVFSDQWGRSSEIVQV